MALKHVLMVAIIAGMLLGVPVILATGAFSSTTIERTASVNVASDSEGLLALRDGHPNQDIVVEKADGTLAIDLTPGDAAGVNKGGTFFIGSNDQPMSDHAFRIVHQGTQPVSITLNYDLSGSDPSGSANVKFDVYDGVDGSHLGQATETAGTTVPNVQPGDTLYVVVEIDTKGVSKGNDLSGAMDISAS